MSAVNVGDSPKEIAGDAAIRHARDMAQSVTVLAGLLSDAYAGSDSGAIPAGVTQTLISHVEQAISGLTAVAEPSHAAAADDVASSLQELLTRLTASTN